MVHKPLDVGPRVAWSLSFDVVAVTLGLNAWYHHCDRGHATAKMMINSAMSTRMNIVKG